MSDYLNGIALYAGALTAAVIAGRLIKNYLANRKQPLLPFRGHGA
jgi:hypothetical protein